MTSIQEMCERLRAAQKPPEKGELRVWWIPQVPMKPFMYSVKNVAEAMMLHDVLAKYDSFQCENNIKPDYTNIGGLEVYEDNEWCEWNDEEGRDISEYLYKKLNPPE